MEWEFKLFVGRGGGVCETNVDEEINFIPLRPFFVGICKDYN